MRALFFLGALALAGASGWASPVGCPKEISTRQSLAGKQAGWESYSEKQSAHLLRTVDFYVGPPAKLVQLAPDNADSGQDPVWTMAPKDELWVVCRYTDAKVALTKKLGSGFHACAAKFQKQASALVDEASCR